MRELSYSTPPPRKPRKPKGVTAKYRAKRRRAENPVKTKVRAECVMRDGPCRFGMPSMETILLDRRVGAMDFSRPGCQGESQWTHMHSRRRSQTRNQAPEVRHDTKHSFMACQKHHDQYDGRRKPRLFVTAVTANGADGPLKFRIGK